MPWKTILVPHDFSPCAVRAERLAVQLAETHEARLLLLHVASTPPGVDPEIELNPADRSNPAPVALHFTDDPKARLDHIAAGLRARGMEVETEALVGELAETILEHADKHRVDVIVMGTHGRTGLSRLLLGSVAEDVLRRADMPVVTIRYEDEEAMTPLLVPAGA